MNKNKRVKIIAEAGVNHNGELNLAKKLIDVAVKAGADVIKFQYFKAERVASKKAIKAEYQKKNLPGEVTQYEMLKKLELSYDQVKTLHKYCTFKNIIFCSTAFDFNSLLELDKIGLPFIKIASGEINNHPFLKSISKLNKQIILSTGMSTLKEIKKAIKILTSGPINKKNITVLHCNTEYPTPIKDVNLNAMLTIKNALKVDVGYSDHTLGTDIPIAAVALGARVIEKHFTLDRNLIGPDHKASLEPNELIQMVKSIRNIEMALGNGIKKPSESEIRNISIARKSIHLFRSVKKGEKINKEHLISLRPGDGISPMEIPKILGKQFLKDLKKNQLLKRNDFK